MGSVNVLRSATLMVILSASPALLHASAADGRQWVSFDSRETGAAGPRLVLTTESGKEHVVEAEADAELLQYMPDRRRGRFETLSLSLSDKNRVLVRFKMKRLPKFESAQLRLSMHLSATPPDAPFDLALHAVTDRWRELEVAWDTAPAVEETAAVVQSVPATDGEVRIDVTDLVKSWTSRPKRNEGVLIKIAKAVPEGTAPIARRKHDPGSTALRAAIDRWPWAESLDAALGGERPVLGVVVAGKRDETVTRHEEILFSTVLAHPQVTALVATHLTPVRIATPAWTFVGYGNRGADPLAALGTTAVDAGAPALVVARNDGSHVATLASLGTFDHGLVLAFLRNALASTGVELDAPKPTDDKVAPGIALMRSGDFDGAIESLRQALPKAGDRAHEAAYWLAAMLQRRDDEESREILERLVRDGGDDAWAGKAAMRLAWPLRVATNESLAGPAVPDRMPRSVVTRGIDVLLDAQQSDGSWPSGEVSKTDAHTGITALAAHALLVWRDQLGKDGQKRIESALERADDWLATNLARADSRTANSFAAAYYLDYLLDREEADGGARKRIVVAVKQLTAGRCPSGAWSYSLQFGEGRRDGERTHSVNTGLAVAALARAKEARFPVDRRALAGGIDALIDMRKGPGAYTYTYPGEPNFESDDASIARAPLCDLALHRVGKLNPEAVRASMDVFMEYRDELRLTGKTSTSTWLPPHAYCSYFFHFAYYHAAQALAALEDEQSAADLATIQSELLGWVEADGTWVDDLNYGKSYGTAMALLTLRVTGLTLTD